MKILVVMSCKLFNSFFLGSFFEISSLKDVIFRVLERFILFSMEVIVINVIRNVLEEKKWYLFIFGYFRI